MLFIHYLLHVLVRLGNAHVFYSTCKYVLLHTRVQTIVQVNVHVLANNTHGHGPITCHKPQVTDNTVKLH